MSADSTRMERIAMAQCAKLLETKAAKTMPRQHLEALVILAFTYGAAWALDAPDMTALMDAQVDSLGSTTQ